jgi:hypothetical protein
VAILSHRRTAIKGEDGIVQAACYEDILRFTNNHAVKTYEVDA